MDTKDLKLYLTNEEIQKAINEYAQKINQEYEGKTLYCVGIMNGALFFMSDLLRQITNYIVVDTISVASYLHTFSTNNIVINKFLTKDITGQDVLLIEDVLDSGQTLQTVIKEIWKHKPNSLRVVCFAQKDIPDRDFPYDYDVLFTIPDRFVVGYGFDCDDKYRQLPDVYFYPPHENE